MKSECREMKKEMVLVRAANYYFDFKSDISTKRDKAVKPVYNIVKVERRKGVYCVWNGNATWWNTEKFLNSEGTLRNGSIHARVRE